MLLATVIYPLTTMASDFLSDRIQYQTHNAYYFISNAVQLGRILATKYSKTLHFIQYP